MRILVASVLLAGCAAPAPPADAGTRMTPADAGTPGVDAPQPRLMEVPLTVHTADGRAHRFRVEVARTDAEQRIGMMFRRSVAPDHGMLFPYARPERLSFWMRNTLIPLDIIYVRLDGTIARIVNARPLDETPLPAGEPVIAALEIGGGRAAQLGIRPGDRVVSPALPMATHPGPALSPPALSPTALPAPAPRG